MVDLHKAAKLREAQYYLDKAIERVQEALGDTDSGQDLVRGIEDVLLDLAYDIQEFEGAYE